MDSDHQPVTLPGGGELLHRVGDTLSSLESIPGELRRGEPLASHTTIRVGGPADGFFLPANVEALVGAVSLCRARDVPYFILGKGSNVLFSDAGYRGLIISTERLSKCTLIDEHLFAECGLPLSQLISIANAHGNTSLDFLAGIPGSVGGALAMNAGTGERSIGDVVQQATVLSAHGALESLDRAACAFSYRTSSLLESRLPILSATLLLDERTFDRKEFLARRAATQPVSEASAGCAFKNPPARSAGELIERAGLKGFQVGMAKVSDIHANFIINVGGASSNEICRIIDIVRQKVYKSFHILLDLEIEVVDG